MTRLIKKYKNRRLYDMEKSMYITVETLQTYVIEGIDFRVEDSDSGKDITNLTLLQIFVEMENGPSQFLSADVLRQLIRLAQHPLNQSFKSLFEQFCVNTEKFMQTFSPADHKTSDNDWQKQMQELTRQWQSFFKLP